MAEKSSEQVDEKNIVNSSLLQLKETEGEDALEIQADES
jgi:hypothetical protein